MKYNLQVMVALTYDDRDIEVEVEFSDEEVTQIKNLVANYENAKEQPADVEDRLNPCSGICLSALYDKVFDMSLFTISPDDYAIQFSSVLREYWTQKYYDKRFGHISGKQIKMSMEYKPNRDFWAYHRDYIFIGINNLNLLT